MPALTANAIGSPSAADRAAGMQPSAVSVGSSTCHPPHWSSASSALPAEARPRTTGPSALGQSPPQPRRLPGQVAARPVAERVRRHLAPPFLLQSPSIDGIMNQGGFGPSSLVGRSRGITSEGAVGTACAAAVPGVSVSRLYASVETSDGRRSTPCCSTPCCSGAGLAGPTGPSIVPSRSRHGGASMGASTGSLGITMGYTVPPSRPNSRERANGAAPGAVDRRGRHGACTHATSVPVQPLHNPNELQVHRQEVSLFGVGGAAA